MINSEISLSHISPKGMEHHKQRLINTNLVYYADIKMRHHIILLHQQTFPELAEQMKNNPKQATNIYSAFLAMLPLQIKGKLTIELREEIMKTFKVI